MVSSTEWAGAWTFNTTMLFWKSRHDTDKVFEEVKKKCMVGRRTWAFPRKWLVDHAVLSKLEHQTKIWDLQYAVMKQCHLTGRFRLSTHSLGK
jgi:hypothetical protein